MKKPLSVTFAANGNAFFMLFITTLLRSWQTTATAFASADNWD
jgi:hypothetical protein